jgi:hypothetical protein
LAFRDVEAEAIVVPPEFESVDGNAGYAEDPAPPTGVRFHEVHPASEFSQMASGPGVLVQMAFRPDKTVRAPRTTVFHDLELRLSTTDRGPGSLSSRFDDNFGADTTVVYSGDLRMSTQGSGPPDGPRAFNYVVEFQEPFVYDPSEGNLLIDWRASSAEGIPFFDAHDYGDGLNRLLFARSPSASTAVYETSGFSVLEFSASSTLLGDVNLDSQVNGLDVDPFVGLVTGGEFQAEGDMNGDGVVNGLDVDPFVAAVVGGGVAALPEPSTLLLTLAALGILGAWRRKR